MIIFPYYKFDDHQKIILHNDADTLSEECLTCQKFQNNIPCVTAKNVITQCAKGLSVFWDESREIIFFSMRIKNHYDTLKISSKDKAVKVSKYFFENYISHIEENKLRILKENIHVFHTITLNSTESIKHITREIASRNTGNIVRFTPNEIKDLNNFLDQFVSERQKNAHAVEQFFKELTVIYPIYDFNGKLIKDSEIKKYQCRVCLKNKSTCKPTLHGQFNKCPYGYYTFTWKNYFFRGIGLNQEHQRDNKISLALSLQNTEKLLSQEGDNLFIAIMLQRYFHDIAQYVGALRSIFPDEQLPLRQRDEIFTIDVLCDAISVVSDEIYSIVFGETQKKKIIFEPYKLFDKYRICFQGLSNVKINIEREGGQDINAKIIGDCGFEFVALNILLNAIKYLPSNQNENLERNINILFKLTDVLNITIISYGAPVDQDELPRLGEFGFRSRNVHSQNIPGHGFGLNIVKEYCKKNGFDISFKSESDKTITLNGKQYAPFIININMPLFLSEQ